MSVHDVGDGITQAHPAEWARVVAALTRRFIDLDIDLLRRLGRTSESRTAYDQAIALAGNAAESRTLARRRDELA